MNVCRPPELHAAGRNSQRRTRDPLHELMPRAAAGASGFLGKGVEPAQLLDAIRLVADGKALLSPAATRGLIARFLARPEPGRPSDPESLSALTRAATAKTHANRAVMKLGARDRTQLVVIAYETGLVQPGTRTGST